MEYRLILEQMIGMLGVSSEADHAEQLYHLLSDRVHVDVTEICDQVVRISLFLCGILPRLPDDLIYEYTCGVISRLIQIGLQSSRPVAWEDAVRWAEGKLGQQVRFAIASASGVVRLVLAHPDAAPCLVVSETGENIAGGTDATIGAAPRIVSLAVASGQPPREL